MRKLLPAAVLALVAFGTEVASAQSFKPSVFGSVVLPTGDIGNSLNTGFMAGAAADVSLSMPVSWRAEASYARFGLKNDGSGDTGSSSDVSGRINAVFSLPSMGVSPYIIGGGGLYHVMTSFTSPGVVSADLSSNRFGWNVGAGIDMQVASVPARIEARYHSVSMDGGGKYTYMPITFGIRF
jgi:opacity protein-like surface antigen